MHMAMLGRAGRASEYKDCDKHNLKMIKIILKGIYIEKKAPINNPTSQS